MSGKSIKELLQDIVKDGQEIYSIICKVDSVDNSARTCDVTPLDGSAKIFDVKLQADEDQSTGWILFPKTDSNVIITFLNKDQAFVSLVTEIEEAHLNGSDNGGLIIIQKLVDKLNVLENAFNSHIHTTTATVSATPVVGVIAPTTSTVQTTKKSDLENSVILH